MKVKILVGCNRDLIGDAEDFDQGDGFVVSITYPQDHPYFPGRTVSVWYGSDEVDIIE